MPPLTIEGIRRLAEKATGFSYFVDITTASRAGKKVQARIEGMISILRRSVVSRLYDGSNLIDSLRKCKNDGDVSSWLKKARKWGDANKVSFGPEPKKIEEAQTRYIHLQGIGKVPAKLGREVKVGDLLSYNYMRRGYRVLSIEPASAAYLRVKFQAIKDENYPDEEIENGPEYVRRIKKDRLIAAYTPPAVDEPGQSEPTP